MALIDFSNNHLFGIFLHSQITEKSVENYPANINKKSCLCCDHKNKVFSCRGQLKGDKVLKFHLKKSQLLLYKP